MTELTLLSISAIIIIIYLFGDRIKRKMSKIKQIICSLFHWKLWKHLEVVSNDIFNYDKFYCPKCDWYFYDTPYDLEDVENLMKEI